MGNGSFEQPQTNEIIFLEKLPCWKIERGNVAEIDTAGQWTAAHGSQSLDLDPHSPGTISQVLNTEIEQSYTLKFLLAGNMLGSAEIKRVEVFWDDYSLGIFSYDSRGKTPQNPEWKGFEVNIPPNKTLRDKTVLKFVSLMDSSVGPVLDKIEVRKQ